MPYLPPVELFSIGKECHYLYPRINLLFDIFIVFVIIS